MLYLINTSDYKLIKKEILSMQKIKTHEQETV